MTLVSSSSFPWHPARMVSRAGPYFRAFPAVTAVFSRALLVAAVPLFFTLTACQSISSGAGKSSLVPTTPASSPAPELSLSTIQQGLLNLASQVEAVGVKVDTVQTNLDARIEATVKGVEYSSTVPWKVVLLVSVLVVERGVYAFWSHRREMWRIGARQTTTG